MLWLGAVPAHGALYIGNGGKILRSSLDGSVREPEFILAGWTVCGIAVTPTHVYWTDSYGDTIGRANLDGSGVQVDFIKLADNAVPCEIAVDSEFVYWASKSGAIGRARLDGSQAQPSFIATPHPCSVAVSETAIYWGSETEEKIWRTDVDGVNGPELVLEDVVDPCGIALTSSHLFWVERESAIGRANLDGSEAMAGFITGADIPTPLRIHGGHLYWLNAGTSDRSIGRADVTGANVDQAWIGGLGWAYALAVDDVPVHPRPPVEPPPLSTFEVGKLRRLADGSVLLPVDLRGGGWLEAHALGVKVTVGPERAERQATLGPGRSWLRITPTTKRGDGSRCVLRAFRRGLKVKRHLRIRFAEPGKGMSEGWRSFQLFKPAALKRRSRAGHEPRTVSCVPRPAPR